MRGPRSRAAALTAFVTAAVLGCRGIVDDLFGSEQPSDSPTDYDLQIVVANQPSGTTASLIYVETVAPEDAYLAVRVVDGRLGPLRATPSDDDTVACMCVPRGVNQFPFVV